MAKNRTTMIKKCPQCEHEVATATKLCPCGFSFFEKRKSSRTSGSDELISEHLLRSAVSDGARRRGVRVRKETQTYGTTVPSATLDTKIRSPKAGVVATTSGSKKRRGTGGKDCPTASTAVAAPAAISSTTSATSAPTTTTTVSSAASTAQDEDTNSEEGTKRKRGRKGRDERFQEQEEKLMSRITTAQAKRHALILSHINYTIRQENFQKELDSIGGGTTKRSV